MAGGRGKGWRGDGGGMRRQQEMDKDDGGQRDRIEEETGGQWRRMDEEMGNG